MIAIVVVGISTFELLNNVHLKASTHFIVNYNQTANFYVQNSPKYKIYLYIKTWSNCTQQDSVKTAGLIKITIKEAMFV